MQETFFHIALGFYLLGTLSYLAYLLKQSAPGGKVISDIAFVGTVLGFVFHTATFFTRMTAAGYLPISSLFESILFFSWAVIFALLFLEYKYGTRVLGSFLLPVVLIFLLAASALPQELSAPAAGIRSTWVAVHTTFTLLGNAAFALAFATGVMYLIQERQLKSKHPGAFFQRLPPLEILDQISYRSISLGLLCLTIGIVSGFLWARSAWSPGRAWDPIEVWTGVTWLIYAAFLHGRVLAGWRGRRAAWFAVVGFALVVFTFFGVSIYLSGLHSL